MSETKKPKTGTTTGKTASKAPARSRTAAPKKAAGKSTRKPASTLAKAPAKRQKQPAATGSASQPSTKKASAKKAPQKQIAEKQVAEKQAAEKQASARPAAPAASEKAPVAAPPAPPPAKGLAVSPLAPKSLPEMPEIKGVELGTCHSGSKYRNRDDLLVVKMPAETEVAGVFTTSKTASAPVDWCKANLEAGGKGRMLVVNAGNSNAFTGRTGVASVKAVGAAAATAGRCRQRDVFMASTGVIGEPLDPVPIISGIDAAMAKFGSASWLDAARAIMTTDTYPKLAARTAKIGDTEVQIAGIAKGSGMIAPDLATMLSFLFTDAALPGEVLQTLLLLTVRDSFNAITVDSDTSTSDTVLLFATGAAWPEDEPTISRAADPRLRDFREKLMEVATELAHQIVKDGEGATKFVEISVSGAASHKAAHRIAMAVADSPLVKTAIAGEDPNWGRIVMAVGKSGEEADRDRLAISIGGIAVARDGQRVDNYDEAPVAQHMKGETISIHVDVGVGRASATVWTCDLTHGYISINADYRS